MGPPLLQKRVRFHAVHHKNDGRTSSYSSSPISFVFPLGPITSLLLAHIEEGQKLLTSPSGDRVVQLFVNRHGRAFSDATFQHFWAKLMSDTAPATLDYFAPSLARTIYVEDITSAEGESLGQWSWGRRSQLQCKVSSTISTSKLGSGNAE